MSDLTDRDLDLIEVALESAVSACGTPFSADDDSDRLAAEYGTALKHVRKTRKGEHVTPRLTKHEAETLYSLLSMVLTNGDQWAFMDLRALNRVAKKLGD